MALSKNEFRLRSFNSHEPLYVIFRNRSACVVQPNWVDFSGNLQPYPAMPPFTSRTMITEIAHIWLFREDITDVPMIADNNEVFMPSIIDHEEPPVVNIYLPVFTLKETCLLMVKSLVKSADYHKLDIVKSLYEELRDPLDDRRDLRKIAIRFWEQTMSESS